MPLKRPAVIAAILPAATLAARAGPLGGHDDRSGVDEAVGVCSQPVGSAWSLSDDCFARADGGCRLGNPVALRRMEALPYDGAGDGAGHFEGATGNRRLFIARTRGASALGSASALSRSP